MPQAILAIDVGTYSIKLTRATRALGEFEVDQFHEIPYLGQELLTHSQAVTASLTRFLQEHPIRFDTVVTSLSGFQTGSRLIDFPFISSKKMGELIEFELENYVPFQVEELAIDYRLVRKEAGQTTALVAYTLREELVQLIQTLSEAGCDPRFISAEASDLANLHSLGILPPEGCYMLLDLGHSKTNLCLMEGSKLEFARTLSIGGKRLTYGISQALGISLEEAENLKITKGQISPFEEEKELGIVIRKVMEELLIEIKQTLLYFHEKYGKKIEAIYLCGGTSRLQGVDQYLSAELRVNTSLLDLVDPSWKKLEIPDTARPLLASSLCSVLRMVYPSKTFSVNFREGEFTYKRDLEAISGHFKKIAILPAAVIILGILSFSINYYTLNQREKKMNRNVSTLIGQVLPSTAKVPAGASGALNFVNSKINETKERLKKLEGDAGLSGFEILRLISGNLPSRQDLKLEVDDISITMDHVRFEGRTLSYEAIDRVKNSLEKVPQFKNVQSGNVRKGVQDELKFSLSFDVGGGDGQGK